MQCEWTPATTNVGGGDTHLHMLLCRQGGREEVGDQEYLSFSIQYYILFFLFFCSFLLTFYNILLEMFCLLYYFLLFFVCIFDPKISCFTCIHFLQVLLTFLLFILPLAY